MFFTTSCQAELNTHINCDLADMTVLWLLTLTPETSLLDSCSKTCISLHKLIFTLILYIVAFCQLFIKDMMMMMMMMMMKNWRNWPRNSREPCHQLVSSNGDRQRARAFYQMDRRGHIHPNGRATGHEPWWGQLPTEPRIWPLSWHGVFPLCQEPEELSTSFFWWRLLIEVETSSFR